MVLDLPGIVEAKLVCQLDLVERILQQIVLGVLGPRPRKLVFVEKLRISWHHLDVSTKTLQHTEFIVIVIVDLQLIEYCGLVVLAPSLNPGRGCDNLAPCCAVRRYLGNRIRPSLNPGRGWIKDTR